MSKLPWLKIGAVAALSAIIAGAAASGWVIGRGDAAQQIAELRQRLAADAAPKQSCGLEVEFLDAHPLDEAGPANPFGLTLGGILPKAPLHLHLREMLTAR